MKSAVETEVKIRLPQDHPDDSNSILTRIRNLGATESDPRTFESNTLYDTPAQSLRSQKMLLRLRQSGDKRVITWKGLGEAGPHKSRPELETTVGSLAAMQQILGQLGYSPVFRYEKFRTEYSLPNSAESTVITFDETPIGDFLEIEGPSAWIDETARRLGFSPSDYILDSYGKLYLDDCARRGVQPSHMLFPSQPEVARA